jgi:hypothetical protein
MLIDCFMFLFVLLLFLFVLFFLWFAFFLYSFHVCVKGKLLIYGSTCGGRDNQAGFLARVFALYHVHAKHVYHDHVKGGLIIYIINPVQLYSSSFLFFSPFFIYIILIFERHILFSLIIAAVSIESIRKELM